MRKPFFTVLLCLSLPACLWADPVGLKEAKQIAAAYMSDGKVPESPVNSVSKRSLADGSAPLYIFNRGNNQGFVIVSGDDCRPAILGYTEQGDYDPQSLPPALTSWIEAQAEMVSAAQAQGATARSVAVAAATGRQDVAPLVTAHWSQGAPYNNLCPYRTDGGGRALTGCVATAAAQVLYYWRKEMPARTQYDTPTYSYGAPVTESTPAGTPLQWGLLQDSYGGSTPDDMNTAVATLMVVTGTSTWLTYGASTSGQISNLVNTFYSQFLMHATCTYKSGISQTNWENMIYSDLAKGWPIVYSGVSPSSGGHAVVVDGYRASDNLFHFNFGWGGSGDGYFTVDDVTGMNGFNSSQGMVHSIHPRTFLLDAEISVETMYTRMRNTVAVNVTNRGTSNYQGVYFATSRYDSEPSSIDDASQSNTTTAVAPGTTDTIEFNLRPTSAGTYYFYVMDSNGRILARKAVEAEVQEPALALDRLSVDASIGTAEEVVTLENGQQTIIYNNVYADTPTVRLAISNGDEATLTTPTVRCDLYKYDADQSAFVLQSNQSENAIVMAPGATSEFEFAFDAGDTGALYAACVNRSYRAGNVDYVMDAAPEDTVIYFRLAGCDLALQATESHGAVVSGHWNCTRFEELAAATSALYFDLTAVDGIDALPDMGNPNTLFYLASSSSATGPNIVKDGVCEELNLTAGYDFYAPADFTARRASFDPQTNSMLWKFIVLPFDCDVPAGSRSRRISKFTNILVTESDEVNTSLKSCTPYLYRTAQPGNDRLTATDVTVSTRVSPDCSDSVRATFLNIEAVAGQRMLNQNSTQSFEERVGATIPAFSGYLNYDKDVSVSIYAYQAKDRLSQTLGETLAQAYAVAAEPGGIPSEEALATFLAQVDEAATCFTRHPESEEITSNTDGLAAAITAFRQGLSPEGDEIDLTEVFLTNPSFEASSVEGWDIERATTEQRMSVRNLTRLNYYMVDADGSYVFHSYSNTGAGSVTLSQSISGLQAGFYRVEAWLATGNGQQVDLFANDVTATMTGDDFGDRYMRQTVIDSLLVNDGTLTLGVKGNEYWYKADNFRLYYLGNAPSAVASATIPAESLKAYGGQGRIVLQGVEGKPVQTSVYTTDGRLVRQVEVNGYAEATGLPRGIYIVARQKVVVR